MMSDPLQKLIARTLDQSESGLQSITDQLKEKQDELRQMERQYRDADAKLGVLHEEHGKEEEQIATHRLRIEELEHQLEDERSRMKAQEDLHDNTRAKLKETRKQLRAVQHERDVIDKRRDKLIEKKNKHNAKLQNKLEQLLEEHLEKCWAELGSGKDSIAGAEALARLRVDMGHDEELAKHWDELTFWEKDTHPESPTHIRQQRLAELRDWIESRYPGALAARRYQQPDTILSLEEIFYKRCDDTYILPLPVPADIWTGLQDSEASREQDIAIHVLWAVLKELPSDTETSIETGNAVPILRCKCHPGTVFPDTIRVPSAMDFLLSPIPPRLENSRLFK